MRKEIFLVWNIVIMEIIFQKTLIEKSLKESKIKFKKYRNIEKMIAKKIALGK
jgi:hypothetical protein